MAGLKVGDKPYSGGGRGMLGDDRPFVRLTAHHREPGAVIGQAVEDPECMSGLVRWCEQPAGQHRYVHRFSIGWR